MNNTEMPDSMVDLASFADLAGFPVEMVKKELFKGSSIDTEVSLVELREVMLKYLDKTMLDSK